MFPKRKIFTSKQEYVLGEMLRLYWRNMFNFSVCAFFNVITQTSFSYCVQWLPSSIISASLSLLSFLYIYIFGLSSINNILTQLQKIIRIVRGINEWKYYALSLRFVNPFGNATMLYSSTWPNHWRVDDAWIRIPLAPRIRRYLYLGDNGNVSMSSDCTV